MKNFLIVLFVLFQTAHVLYARQSDKFDIVQFDTPKGWQKETGTNTVQFGSENADGSCIITIFKSINGTDSPTENFHYAWTSIVRDLIDVSLMPQMLPGISEKGWASESGFAAYESDGKKGVVLLVSITGGGKLVNILVLTDTNSFQPEIDAFLESVKLPEVNLSSAAAENRTSGPTPLSNRVWKSFQNRKDSSGNYAGYSTNTYEFFPNGRYKFTNVVFQLFEPKYSIAEEEGTYAVSGNSISINPEKSSFRVHQKEKTDPAVRSGELKPELTRYGLQFLTIYDRQRMILSPDGGRETKRDGTFNYYSDGRLTSSYLYDAQ
ncbi:MAG: hypothetical protein R2681_02585 [Pyrinomonadaceae bacterium]